MNFSALAAGSRFAFPALPCTPFLYRCMRISLLSFFLVALSAQLLTAAAVKAQRLEQQSVDVSLRNASLLDAFKQIEDQTAFRFMYRKSDIGHIRHLNVPAGKQNLAVVLGRLLAPHHLSFRQVDNRILIQTAAAAATMSALPADSLGNASGRVTGDDGNPVIGATVVVKGTAKGAITNENGQFTITDVPEGAILIVTSLGYRQTEFRVKDRGALALQLPLQTGGSRLNEVVVIGYGTQQKRELTGSIGKVGALNAEENMVSNPISALQGRVAGLAVSNTGSAPGSMPNFTIRGVQTVQSNMTGSGSNPLIVVDGLVIDAGPEGANANFSMFNLNPQDIASIEVLKDAASSAIYGARGAQGVIMITTKKGNFGARPTVAINAYTGANSSHFSYRPLNNAEYSTLFSEARQNRINDIKGKLTGTVPPAEEQRLRQEMAMLGLQIDEMQMGSSDINWLDRVVPRSAALSNIQANVSGGSSQTSYYLSFGKYSENNATGTGRLDRYSAKLALTQKVNRWLKAGADFSVSKVKNDGIASAIGDAISARPDTPDSIKLLGNGMWDYWYGYQPHPLGTLNGYYQNEKDNWNYTGNVFAEATINKNFSFRSMVAGSRSESAQRYFYSPFSYYGLGTQGDYLENGNSGIRYTLNNVLTYRFGYRQLKADVVLGQEFTGNQYRTTALNLQGFPLIEGLWKPGNASVTTNFYNSGNRFYEEYSESYFLRSNMSWAGKYLLSFSLRRDGSSKLENNRHAWFPAVSGGWIVSDESFLRGNHLLSYLKVRSSFGITGNIRPIGLYDTRDLINSALYLNEPALRFNTTLGNPDLKWERTRQYDIGLETRFFGDRLSVTAEYYMKKTDNLLSSRQIPFSSGGFISQRVNVGAMTNQGVDLSVGLGSRPGTAFRWEVTAVANINRNRVTELRDSTMAYGVYFPGSPSGVMRIGQPLGLLQLYNSLGVDPQTGDMVYEDRNKDGIINQADMIYVPVAQPKVTGGLNIDLGWKGFSLNTQLAFNLGNKIYNFSEQRYRSYDYDLYTSVMNNKPSWVLERWQQPGDKSRYPRAITGVHGAGQTTDWNVMSSTQYLYSGSYLRCRNVTLAYNLPATLTGKAGLQQVRVYAATQNLFTIKDKRLNADDPEQALESGLQQDVAPLPRAISFGIDLRF